MAALDRFTGVNGDIAIKTPVRAVATSNIVLSGLQTIDSVALAEGDRVLVAGQTDATTNGIYGATAGLWQRTKDFDGPSDVASGTIVVVTSGALNGGSLWRLNTPDPITVGTTALTLAAYAFPISPTLDSLGSSRGSLLYRGSASWAALGPGTAGQVLTSGGSSADPYWGNAGTGTVTSVAFSDGFATSGGGPVTGSGTVYATDRGVAGRLTLTSGAPVMNATVSAATTIYLTPYNGDLHPIWRTDLGKFVMRQVGEISQTLSDTTRSPSAAAAGKVYDLFEWDLTGVGGTVVISRGPAWRNGGQAITGATNASPIVITANGHGLSTGDDASVRGVGGNTAANGDWTVTVVDANTFSLNGSTGNGAYTSGTGGFASRGRGAGTTELQTVNGYPVNKNAISNGPGAGAGLYRGTIATDTGGATVTWNLGSAAAGGGAAWLGVWNMYNRLPVHPVAQDSTASWTYASATWRAADGSNSNRISFVAGLAEDPFTTRHSGVASNSASGYVYRGIGFDSITAISGQPGTNQVASAATFASSHYSTTALGLHYAQALECISAGTGTFFGNSSGLLESWLEADWRC